MFTAVLLYTLDDNRGALRTPLKLYLLTAMHECSSIAVGKAASWTWTIFNGT